VKNWALLLMVFLCAMLGAFFGAGLADAAGWMPPGLQGPAGPRGVPGAPAPTPAPVRLGVCVDQTWSDGLGAMYVTDVQPATLTDGVISCGSGTFINAKASK
jgi:hypothetical protein